MLGSPGSTFLSKDAVLYRIAWQVRVQNQVSVYLKGKKSHSTAVLEEQEDQRS